MALHPTKEIRIPPAFCKLHGKKAKAVDLILTYLLAVIVMVYNLVEAEFFPVWKVNLIAILSLDIGGGVASNFTDSTIAYYRNEGLSPHAFVWFHLLQSALLVFLFWECRLEAIVLSIFAMLFSSATIVLNSTHIQKQASIFFLKLLLGFAAHWKKND